MAKFKSYDMLSHNMR